MTKTALASDWGDEDEPNPRKFNRFYNRPGAEVLRNLKIPVDILDRIERFKEENNLDPDKIAKAAESGSEIADAVSEELTNVKLIAMEGLIVQQGINSLSKTQAGVEQQQKIHTRNQHLLKRNRELEAYTKDLVITLTWTQLKAALPYIGIAALCITAVAVTHLATKSSNGSSVSPNQSQSPAVQPQVVPSTGASPGS